MERSREPKAISHIVKQVLRAAVRVEELLQVKPTREQEDRAEGIGDLVLQALSLQLAERVAATAPDPDPRVPPEVWQWAAAERFGRLAAELGRKYREQKSATQQPVRDDGHECGAHLVAHSIDLDLETGVAEHTLTEPFQPHAILVGRRGPIGPDGFPRLLPLLPEQMQTQIATLSYGGIGQLLAPVPIALLNGAHARGRLLMPGQKLIARASAGGSMIIRICGSKAGPN